MAEHLQGAVKVSPGGAEQELGADRWAMPCALGSPAILFHKHLWAKGTLQLAVNSQKGLKPDRHCWVFCFFFSFFETET